MCASEAGAAPLSLPYAAAPAAGAGTRSPRRRAAGAGEEGRGAEDGHRPDQASPRLVEPPLYSARRRCVTQRRERACVSCRGASAAEGCRAVAFGLLWDPEGLAVGWEKRCVQDTGVFPPRLLLRALRWPLSPLPRGDSAGSATPADALQGRGRGGRLRRPASARGSYARGGLRLRVMAGGERALWVAACAEAAAEAAWGAEAPHRGRSAFGGGRTAPGASADPLRPLRWVMSLRAPPLCLAGQSLVTLPAAAWWWRGSSAPGSASQRAGAISEGAISLLRGGSAAPPLSPLSPPLWAGGWRRREGEGERERQARSAAAPSRRSALTSF